MTQIFFTADQHFGHANIIKHAQRPFASLEEMHAELIRRWNAVVTPKDVVYVLGDFAFKGARPEIQAILSQLRGAKHLILGNHDPKWIDRLDGWLSVETYVELTTAKQPIVLFHYPIDSWNRKFHGALHLHGHVHTRHFGGSTGNNRIDVGVDAHAFAPVSFTEVLEIANVNLPLVEEV